MTTITNTPRVVTVNGQPVSGREWIVDVTMPTESSTDATDYIARNTGKTRTIYAFLGIPYSRQPVGAFRYRPAVKVAPSGPIDASRYGEVAPQGYSEEGSDTGRGRTDLGVARGLSAWAALGTREGENCLNLNIYTPDPTRSLPVVVQFHGGGSNYLSACDDRLAGHRLATKGVVVVRVEYRLGNLGTYYIEGMEDEDDYQGPNLMLSDAKAALEWVRDHIAAFGGNKDRVTICGGSAGGNMVQCIAANPNMNSLWDYLGSSSASAGFDPRVTVEPFMGMPSWQEWYNERNRVLIGTARSIPDALDPTRTFADAINIYGLRRAIRERLRLSDLMAIDEGATGVQLNGTIGYQPTRSLTVVRDNITVFHDNNRAAALAGAFPARPMMLACCEDEASVLGPGFTVGNPFFFTGQLRNLCNLTTHQWSVSSVYDTEYNGNPGTPTWGAVDPAFPRLPWAAAPEPNRMIFNHGYQHAAYCVARSVAAKGAPAYLVHWNYRALNKASTQRAGHTSDEPYWFNNPLWDLDPPGMGIEPITTQDIAMADAAAQLLANFSASGNPNTSYASPWDFSLFASPLNLSLTAFNATNKNWNVAGNPFRSAIASPATMVNYNDFWEQAWDLYDARVGA